MTPARILIVEDERLVSRDVESRLTRFGYSVVGSTALGEEAIRLTEELRPDLVLMDIRLEGAVDGVAAAQAIHERFRVPVVYLTAYADDETLARARVTEPFGYILKPFEERELRTAVEMAVYKHQAECRLRESEHRWAVTLASIGDAVIATDAQGRVRFLNPVAEQLTGWPLGEASGRALSEVFRIANEQTREPAEDPVARALGTGNVVGLANHTVLLARDGREVPIDDCGAPIRDDHGTITGVVLVFQDVTEHRRAEEALRESEERFRSTFEHTNVAMVLSDISFRFLRVNAAFCRLLGYSEVELVERSMQDLTHPDDVAACLAQMAALKAGACSSFQIEKRFFHKSGRLVWGLTSVSVVRNAQGQPSHHVVQVQDITQHKALEEQLRQAQKMEAVGRLAGGIAHDFNNLLTAIFGYTQMALAALGEQDPRRELIEGITLAADRAAGLARQLLLFGRKQAHRLVVLNLNDVVAGAEQLLRRLVGEHIKLEIALGDSLRPIRADRGQLEQVLFNLAVNARDAMPGGGRMGLVTANEVLDESQLRAHPGSAAGSYVRLTVADSGCGMDAEVLSHLFEPFFTTKQVGQGTGLGLATAYGIVKQAGGHFEVASEVGRGTVFTLYLPAIEGTPETSRPSAAPIDLPRGAETVLLAEDDEAIRRLARRVLQEKGYTVLEASNGHDALAQSRQHPGPIHLLLTDVAMPEMGGPELARLVAQERPATRVLYMSGYSSSAADVLERAENEGRLLRKPFLPTTLCEQVRAALGSMSGS
jgi:PAS domain S-box-containing protein